MPIRTAEASGLSVRSVKNDVAVRAAEKAGFRTVHEFNDPESGLCCYMILADESVQGESRR